MILHTIENEFNALDNPTSPFNSSVYAGAADAMGLNARIMTVWRTSIENGSK